MHFFQTLKVTILEVEGGRGGRLVKKGKLAVSFMAQHQLVKRAISEMQTDKCLQVEIRN